MSWITAKNKKPETMSEKYERMSTEELKKVIKKKSWPSIIFLVLWVALLLVSIYYYLPAILLWMSLPFIFFLLNRKNMKEIREISAIFRAKRLTERVNREELSAPFSLSDFRKKIFYYKLIWKFGPEKGSAIYILGAFILALVVLIIVSNFIFGRVWLGSSGPLIGDLCSLSFFIVWMAVLNYFTMKKQADELRYYIKKELKKKEEHPPALNEPAFRTK